MLAGVATGHVINAAANRSAIEGGVMSAFTVWDVVVRKSYTDTIQVLAETENDAYAIAQQEPGVVMIERVTWNDPDAAEAQKP